MPWAVGPVWGTLFTIQEMVCVEPASQMERKCGEVMSADQRMMSSICGSSAEGAPSTSAAEAARARNLANIFGNERAGVGVGGRGIGGLARGIDVRGHGVRGKEGEDVQGPQDKRRETRSEG